MRRGAGYRGPCRAPARPHAGRVGRAAQPGSYRLGRIRLWLRRNHSLLLLPRADRCWLRNRTAHAFLLDRPLLQAVSTRRRLLAYDTVANANIAFAKSIAYI